MFKRLRERIAEEAIKFPVGQYANFGNNPGRPGADPTQAAGVTDTVTEDLIVLNDSSSVVVPHTSPQQFSIDEDGPFSEQSTPQKGLADSSAGSEQFATPTGTGQEHYSLNTEAQNILPNYQPKFSSYVPQSDIESEVEEPPTLNLDGISKEQLTATTHTLKAKLCKFKNKYTEVVRAYKDLHEEKKKIEHALTESQDKALRRISELREQCQLEQKAKAHLEENLRLMLEEKEEMISVLQTKISLLKEEGNTNNLETVVEDPEKSSPEVCNKTGDQSAGEDEESTLLREKIKKMEELLIQCKDKIKANKDQTTQLLKQKENLSHMLEKKTKELEEIQGKDDNSQSDLRIQLDNMQVRLVELEQQQEENSMSMAETKKNMHEELELKEQQLVKAKEEVRQLQQSVEQQKQDINKLKRQHEEKIIDLQNQLKLTEKTMEEEKQNLMQEFSRGKAAAVALMQQECGKKLAAVEEEWKTKLEEFQKTSHAKEKEMADNILQKESEVKLIQQEVEEKRFALKELENRLEQHSNSIESSDKGADLESLYNEKLNELKTEHEKILNDKEMIIHSLECARNDLRQQLDDCNNALIELKTRTEIFQETSVCLEENLKDTKSALNEKDTENEKMHNSNNLDLLKLQESLTLALAEKEELVLQLEKCNTGNDRLKQLQCEYNTLIEQSTKNIDELKTKNELLLKENEKLCSELQAQMNAVFDTKTFLGNTEEKLNQITNRCAEMDIHLKIKCDKIEELQQAVNSLEFEKSNLNTSVKDCEEIIKNQKENTSSLEQKLVQLNEEKNTISEELVNYKAEVDVKKVEQEALVCALKEKTKELEEFNTQLEQQMSVKTDENNKLQQNVHMLETKIASLEDEIYHLKKVTEECNNKMTSLEIQNSMLEKEKETQLQNYTILSNKNEELKHEVQKERDSIFDKENKLKGLGNVCADLEKQLKVKLEEDNEIKNQMKELETKVENLKTYTQHLEKTNKELNEKLMTIEKEFSQLQEDKELNQKRILELGELLSSAEEEKRNLNENINSLHSILDDMKTVSDEASIVFAEEKEQLQLQANSLQILLRDIQSKNANLESEVLLLKNTSGNQVAEFVHKISTLEKSLTQMEEERNNLSMVLESVEKEYDKTSKEKEHELEFSNEEITLLSASNAEYQLAIDKMSQKEKSYEKQIAEMKIIIKDLQYRETEQNNLLEKTRNDYDKHIEEINSKLKMEITAFNIQTDNLKDELENLRQQLKCSQCVYDEKVNQLTASEYNKINELAHLKEEFDLSLSNVSNLKSRLNELEIILVKKEEELAILSNDKTEFEKNICELKEKYEQNECDLKEAHNIQLSELRDQTKQTIEKLHCQLKQANENAERKYEEYEANMNAISKEHKLVAEKIKELQLEKEMWNEFQTEAEEKMKNLKNKLDTAMIYLKETDSAKEIEIQEKLLAIEEATEWKSKYLESEQRIQDLSNKLTNDCQILQELVDQKENDIKIAELKLNDIKQEFEIEKEKYEMQIKELGENLQLSSNVATTVVELKDKLENSEKLMAETKNDFQKAHKELEEEYKKKVGAVNKKFIEKLKLQQEKYKSQMQKVNEEKQQLVEESIGLKSVLEETNRNLKKNEKYILDITEQNTLKIAEIDSIKIALTEKESVIASNLIKINELSNHIAHMEEKIKDLNNYNNKFETIFKHYISDEISADSVSNYIKNLNARCKHCEETVKVLEKNISDNQSASLEQFKLKEEELQKLNNEFLVMSQKYENTETQRNECEAKIRCLEQEFKILVDEKEAAQQLKTKLEELEVSLNDKTELNLILESKLKLLEEKFRDQESSSAEKLSLLTAKYKKETEEFASRTVEEHKLKLGELKKKAELKLAQIKKQLQAENDQALRCSEDKLNFAETNYTKQIEDMKKHISELETENEKYRNEMKELTSSQSQVDKEKSELITEIKSKEEEFKMVKEQMELCKKELENKLVLSKEDLKEKENSIAELRDTIRSLEMENQTKLEDAKRRIKQLEHEREQLMIQAQERVSATEAKCREDISLLEEKINKLQLDNTEVEKLRSEIGVLNAQLDESLLVAESNQAVAAEEISKIRANLNNVHEELASALDSHAIREAELLSQVQKLQEDNSELQEDKKCIDSLKAEKEELNNKVKELEDQTKSEISLLKEENERLRIELAGFASLKEDKEELNAKIHALELNEEALSSQVEQLRIESKTPKQENSLQQSSTPNDCNLLQKELLSLKEENNLLKERLHILEEIDSNDPNDIAFKQYIDTLKKEYEGRLYAKDAELDSRLKHVIKDFCSQMNIKDKDYDEMVAEILEKSQSHEEKLLREHRLEIVSLRQEIFEKDCALEEMHDHYEELVQEKDAKIKEYEKTVETQKIGSSSKDVFLLDRGMHKTEVSDWDDGWVVTEEAGDSSSPIHCTKGDCGDHVQQIESMQEELNKCNSEIKDLRILLRLSPPSSLASNNNYNHSSLHVPEPTEFEYLKNILFKYMMGKETLTLAKVIAAVLRFNEEQTQLVLEKEEARHTMK